MPSFKAGIIVFSNKYLKDATSPNELKRNNQSSLAVTAYLRLFKIVVSDLLGIYIPD